MYTLIGFLILLASPIRGGPDLYFPEKITHVDEVYTNELSCPISFGIGSVNHGEIITAYLLIHDLVQVKGFYCTKVRLTTHCDEGVFFGTEVIRTTDNVPVGPEDCRLYLLKYLGGSIDVIEHPLPDCRWNSKTTKSVDKIILTPKTIFVNTYSGQPSDPAVISDSCKKGACLTHHKGTLWITEESKLNGTFKQALKEIIVMVETTKDGKVIDGAAISSKGLVATSLSGACKLKNLNEGNGLKLNTGEVVLWNDELLGKLTNYNHKSYDECIKSFIHNKTTEEDLYDPTEARRVGATLVMQAPEYSALKEHEYDRCINVPKIGDYRYNETRKIIYSSDCRKAHYNLLTPSKHKSLCIAEALRKKDWKDNHWSALKIPDCTSENPKIPGLHHNELVQENSELMTLESMLCTMKLEEFFATGKISPFLLHALSYTGPGFGVSYFLKDNKLVKGYGHNVPVKLLEIFNGSIGINKENGESVDYNLWEDFGKNKIGAHGLVLIGDKLHYPTTLGSNLQSATIKAQVSDLRNTHSPGATGTWMTWDDNLEKITENILTKGWFFIFPDLSTSLYRIGVVLVGIIGVIVITKYIIWKITRENTVTF